MGTNKFIDRSLRFIGPDGTAWFGASSSFHAALFNLGPGASEPSARPLTIPKGENSASSLTFGPEGDLWFLVLGYLRTAIGRLDPAGGLTEFRLPDEEDANYAPNSLTIGPEGNLWFTRPRRGKVGTMTPTGAVTEFDVGRRAVPAGIATGSDGAIWFTEKRAGKIGRITPASGEVEQFPIPFGRETEAIAADPRGAIWFGTAKHEISSISTSGTVGARGCLDAGCEAPIESLAIGPDGSLWFAAGIPQCRECGGGTQLLTDQQGTRVGRIPAGALAPPIGQP